MHKGAAVVQAPGIHIHQGCTCEVESGRPRLSAKDSDRVECPREHARLAHIGDNGDASDVGTALNSTSSFLRRQTNHPDPLQANRVRYDPDRR